MLFRSGEARSALSISGVREIVDVKRMTWTISSMSYVNVERQRRASLESICTILNKIEREFLSTCWSTNLSLRPQLIIAEHSRAEALAIW